MSLELTLNSKPVQKLVNVLLKKMDGKAILKLLGQRQLRWIDVNFDREGVENKWKRLSPNTIAGRRKSSSKILQDSGKLRQSFQGTKGILGLSNDQILVGTKNKLAAFHHFGTKPYTIRPKSKGRLAFKAAGGLVFTKEVHHPGLVARPILPSKGEADRINEKVLTAYVKEVIKDGGG